MSLIRESMFGTQRQPHPSYPFQISPSHAHPTLHQTGKPLHDMARPFLEPGMGYYQTPQSSPQIDWIITTLRQEAARHSQTRSDLQSSCQAHLQTEQLLFQERASNQALRVEAQKAEIRNIYLEGKLRAYEQQQSLHVGTATPRGKTKAHIHRNVLHPRRTRDISPVRRSVPS